MDTTRLRIVEMSFDMTRRTQLQSSATRDQESKHGNPEYEISPVSFQGQGVHALLCPQCRGGSLQPFDKDVTQASATLGKGLLT